MTEVQCRICLNNCSKCSIEISAEIFGKSIKNWMKQIGNFAKDEEDEDHFPETICTDCYQELQDIAECINEVTKNDLLVRSREPGDMSKNTNHDQVNKVLWENADDNSSESSEEFESDYEEEEDESDLSEIEEKKRKPREKTTSSWKPIPLNHQENDTYCKICDKHLYDKYELAQHIDRMHAVKTYACTSNDCNKGFASNYLKNRHMRIAHGIVSENYVQKVPDLSQSKGYCNLCMKNFGDLKRHNDRLHAETKAYKCGICFRAYASSYLMNRHVNQVHNKSGMEDVEQFLVKVTPRRCQPVTVLTPTCCMCQQTFDTEQNLEQHAKEGHPSPEPKKYSYAFRFECQYCLQKFQTKTAFYQHFIEKDFVEVIRIRSRKGKKQTWTDPGQCYVCGKLLRSSYEMRIHLMRHSEKKPFKCDHRGCIASFSCESYLKDHQKSHGVKENICHICGYGFHRRSKLTDHLKLHALGKLIKCTKCIKMYRTKAEFDIHFAKHVANQCTLCDRAYTKREYLNRHMRSDHGGLPDTTCGKCGRKFIHPGYYRDHEEKCNGVFKPYKPKKKKAKKAKTTEEKEENTTEVTPNVESVASSSSTSDVVRVPSAEEFGLEMKKEEPA